MSGTQGDPFVIDDSETLDPFAGEFAEVLSGGVGGGDYWVPTYDFDGGEGEEVLFDEDLKSMTRTASEDYASRGRKRRRSDDLQQVKGDVKGLTNLILSQKLKHPNILKLRNVKLAPGGYTYTATPLTAFSVLNESLSVDEILSIFRGVLCALLALDREGLAHGNISPEAIFVNSGPTLKGMLGNLGDVLSNRTQRRKPNAFYPDDVLPRQDLHALLNVLHSALYVNLSAAPARVLRQASGITPTSLVIDGKHQNLSQWGVRPSAIDALQKVDALRLKRDISFADVEKLLGRCKERAAQDTLLLPDEQVRDFVGRALVREWKLKNAREFMPSGFGPHLSLLDVARAGCPAPTLECRELYLMDNYDKIKASRLAFNELQRFTPTAQDWRLLEDFTRNEDFVSEVASVDPSVVSAMLAAIGLHYP